MGFYCALGLVPVVDARPEYVRFVCPNGSSTFTLHEERRSAGEQPCTSNAMISMLHFRD
jgi:hypothetical protein